jgi:hypothetical protein
MSGRNFVALAGVRNVVSTSNPGKSTSTSHSSNSHRVVVQPEAHIWCCFMIRAERIY